METKKITKLHSWERVVIALALSILMITLPFSFSANFANAETDDSTGSASDSPDSNLLAVGTILTSLNTSTSITSPPLTKEKYLTISGRSHTDETVQFFVNNDRVPSAIIETGKYWVGTDSNGMFNATIKLSETMYKEALGLNEITIVIRDRTEDENVVKEEKRFLKLDITKPRLYLKDIPAYYNKETAEHGIFIAGYVDENASVVAKIGNETTELELKNQTINQTIDVPQDDGTYDLELIATDLAGNQGILKQKIHVDVTPCELKEIKNQDELEGETQRFPIVSIRGETSEPKCKVYVANIGKKVSLNANEEDWVFGREHGPLTTAEIEVGVGGLIVGKRKEIRSDSDGKFRTQIALQLGIVEGSEKRGRGRFREDERIKDVLEETNTIVLYVEDDAGNRDGPHYLTIEYEPSSSWWKTGRIQVLPNTVYSNNLFAGQAVSNERIRLGQSSRGVEVSVMYDLYYLGPKDDDIKNPSVSVSLDGDKLDNKHISVGESYAYYYKNESKMFVLTKLLVSPAASNYIELEKQVSGNEIAPLGTGLQIDFALEAIVSYRRNDESSSYSEPVYLESAVGLETPFDYNKYLTPEMIEKMVKELDKWVKFLEKAVDYTEKAVYVLTAGCVASTLINYFTGPSDAAMKRTYYICDRVWCPTIPPDCENVKKISHNQLGEKYIFDEKAKKYYKEDDKKKENGLDKAPGDIAFEQQDNETYSSYRWVPGEEAKNALGERICIGKWNAIEIRSRKTKEGSFIIGGKRTVAPDTIRYQCVPITKEEYENSSAQSASVGCYNKERDAPKCFPDSADSVNDDGQVNTYDDIFISTRCGCVSGMRGHLSNALRITNGMKKCLQQSMLGEVRGGYCERLFAQFVCDTIAWAVKEITPSAKEDWEPKVGGGNTFRYNFQAVNQKLNARYGSLIQNRLGLSSDQVVHKACLAAITGDWNDLENLFRQSTRVPVEPIIGPMFPESRFTSWNPFTGEAAINYYLTVGILSGGQEITGSVEIWCDKNEPGGEYCPTDKPILLYGENIYVDADESIESNLYFEDERAKYWGNVAILDLTYESGEEMKRVSIKEQITRKNNFIAQCHFQAIPPGIVCETLRGGVTAVHYKEASLTPNIRKYYPGNSVYIKSDIENANPSAQGEEEEMDAYVVYELKKPDGEIVTNKNNAELSKWKVDLYGREIQVNKLMEFDIAAGSVEEYVWEVDKAKLGNKITFAKTGDTGDSITAYAEAISSTSNIMTKRSIISMKLWDEAGNLGINCSASGSGFKCMNDRQNEFTAGRISYKISASKDDKIGEIQLDGQKITLGTPKLSRSKSKDPAGQYLVNLTLYQDVDSNKIIDGNDLTIPFGHQDAQTKILRFSFSNERPEECRETPEIDILYPGEGDIIAKDMATFNTPNGGVEFTLWDDCTTEENSEIKFLNLYDEKAFRVAEDEASKRKKKGETVEEPYENYDIGEWSFTDKKENGVYVLGQGEELKATYNDGERFSLIIRVSDFGSNIGEDRVTVEMSGEKGIVIATPEEIESCRRSEGSCKMSCERTEREIGRCGNAKCCGRG